MADTPITPILAEIAEMQTAFEQASCAAKEPFIKYPDTGNPPVIDFNLPQSTAFTTYGYLVKYIPPASFKDFTKQVPTNNYYDVVESMTSDQVFQFLNPYVAPTQLSGFFVAQQPQMMQAQSFEKTFTPKYAGAEQHVTFQNPLQVNAVQQNAKNMAMSEYAKQNLRPLLVNRLAGSAQITKYIAKPPAPVPRITVIEEYTTASYLGNYGAGRVVKTLSLAPGERTTITVRTYNDSVSTQEKSQNILDSFSSSSATELDTLMQHEQGDMSSASDTSGGGGSNYNTNSDSKNSSKSFGISGHLNFGIGSIGGGYGQSQSDVQNSSSGFTNTYDYNHTGVRSSNVSALNSAMDKHVQNSNANRQVNVNSSTSDTASSGEEDTTVREIVNYNKSRVLNIVFRQLLQEYTTITYLSNLKFAYSNGYMETYTVVDLNNLVNMLKDIIVDADVNQVLCKLLQPYCNVMNYDDEFKQFVEAVTVEFVDCLGLVGGCDTKDPEVFYRVNKLCSDSYSDDVIDVTVNGVILAVKPQTLQTTSLIADALLGAGEALDCFNQKAQEADNMADFINNIAAMQIVGDRVQTTANDQLFTNKQLDKMQAEIDVITQQIDVITAVSTPADQVAGYKKVFGDCCPTPQYTGGCGCGNCSE